MKKVFLLICAVLGAALLEALPLTLSEKWMFYQAPFPSWEEIDVAKVSEAPAHYGNAERESVSLDKGIFQRETEAGNPSLLVNEFDAPSAGTMYLRCGVNCHFMQVGLNGKMIFDGRTTFVRNADGENGSHVIPLAVKKGRNLLCVKFYGSKEGSPSGKCCYFFAFAEANEAEYMQTLPTHANFAAIGAPGKRHIDEMIIRNGVDEMTATNFAQFERHSNFTPTELRRIYRRYPVLEYYDFAMDKILREVPKTKVSHGIVAWHLYNMGYIIKTPECCFGIDIHHRCAAELAPHLDFILVTHNHSDHYNWRLLKTMAESKKLVISNFYPAKGYQRPPARFEIADVTIESEETDHNATLRKFISAYRIKCGRSADAPVIYHTGDSCDPGQLHPSGKVDIHILHPRVGLSVPEAAKLIHPKEIWFSHLLEMGHCKPSIYRPVDWGSAYEDMKAIQSQGIQVVSRIPMWGEKIVIP